MGKTTQKIKIIPENEKKNGERLCSCFLPFWLIIIFVLISFSQISFLISLFFFELLCILIAILIRPTCLVDLPYKMNPCQISFLCLRLFLFVVLDEGVIAEILDFCCYSFFHFLVFFTLSLIIISPLPFVILSFFFWRGGGRCSHLPPSSSVVYSRYHHTLRLLQ